MDRARAGEGPALIEAKTYRMKGHAEHDGQTYVPGEELNEWATRDPLERYARILVEQGAADPPRLHDIDAEIAARVESDARAVEQSPFPAPESALTGVYAEGVAEVEPAIVRRLW
ncbi:MAG: thiamine pyrophosphate-dependent enzyme [Acidobacteriota bacterium]|nr:thiamine pyrophosphate-dependent enzyme [Acidobacteriota bacterium]